jgi:hypothetical protein
MNLKKLTHPDQTPTDPAFYFGWYDLTREQLGDIFLKA